MTRDSAPPDGLDYVYEIGKYEVTNGQYAEFLNAVAASDPHHVFHPFMGGSFGAISRSGSSGEYAYSAHPVAAIRPIRYVSWGSAARFSNWLHNGRPGLHAPVPQDENSTEDGSYFLDGATTDAALMAITREPDARWVIPTEDEWYKAAYHKNGAPDAGYWIYATRSDRLPTLENPPGTDLVRGSAKYESSGGPHSIGSFTAKPSDSAYGTFDQNGNMAEWVETPWDHEFRKLLGGSWLTLGDSMASGRRRLSLPTTACHDFGFRVAVLAGPGCIFDCARDGDIDLIDFGTFQARFTGPK